MRADIYCREGLPAPSLTAIIGPFTAPTEEADPNQSGFSSFPDLSEEFESLSIPNRGILLGFLASSLLWAALILTVRALWLLLR